ncbi:MAG: hypothetical protein IKE28_11850 [Solobacterium sp.]|nr:hypothetical protein [Solobacterium sp.]
MALKLKYTDDVFSGDRKYQMVQNPDDTVSLEDVTSYSEEGTMIDSTLILQLVKTMTNFVSNTTVFNADGSITETGENGVKVTQFQADGSIIETLTDGDNNSLSKKTRFMADGSIQEDLI